jgi:NAD(P)-dependent dehydrogenase (short-subunit alcohol dehydrogenase family)
MSIALPGLVATDACSCRACTEKQKDGTWLTLDTAMPKSVGVQTDLAGKVAIITGGAGGIGAVFGRALAEQGASVVLADLDHERAAKVADAIAADGGAAIGVGLDVTDPDSARAVVADTTARWGGLDILINSAALMAEIPFSPLETFALDWWQRVIAVNLTGPLLCTQAAAPAMAARGGGRIVNMVSAGAFQRAAGVYGVSKYALVGLTMNLASELGAKGITVNAIAPGLVADEAGMRALPEGPIRDLIKAPIPLKTHVEGPPEDLVGTLVLLVSAAGGWITGQTISVDGGWVMRF